MRLEISCQDRLGITQDILDILTDYSIDLRGIEIDEAGKIFLDFANIEFENFQHLMPKIRRLEGIDDVKTTPFMPIQQERNQLRTLLQTLPDPVFSVDTKGKILLFNDAVIKGLEVSAAELLALHIDEILSGFNFTKWQENRQQSPELLVHTHRVKFIEQDYIADIIPVNVRDFDKSIPAGAVVMLKSEQRLGHQTAVLKRDDDVQDAPFIDIVNNSAAMKKLVKDAKRMAKLNGHMLIFGETGVGKERIAIACHEAKHGAQTPLHVLNFSIVSEQEADAVLFGMSEADGTTSKGLIEQADGGTLLLDEVSEMPMSIQTKLLRYIEDGLHYECNDAYKHNNNVRIVFTTSRDLVQCVDNGTFKDALYYRINILSLTLPPLRIRKADIIPLAEIFIRNHSQALGIRPPKLSKSCVDYLYSYPWPGNVRQLENSLYRAISLLEGNEITRDAIQLPSCNTAVSYIDENFDGTLEKEIKRFEKELLKRLYPSFPSTRQLAKKLGLSHTAIANKLREHGINKVTNK